MVRTVFLLEWLGSNELRQEITATTNKVESYNALPSGFRSAAMCCQSMTRTSSRNACVTTT